MTWRRLILISLMVMATRCFCDPPSTRETENAAGERVPCEIGDNFEDGAMNGWEPYPFAQDPGFNPTIRCVEEPAYHSRFALAHTYAPDDTDHPDDQQIIGVFKRMRLELTQQSRLRCRVFLQSDRRPRRLVIRLCPRSGPELKMERENPPVNAWLEIDEAIPAFSGAEHEPQDGSVELAGVQISAEFGTISPDRSYTINLDDFRLNGERARRFAGIEPATTFLEHFGRNILHRHYARGETVKLRVRPEPGAGSPTQVTAQLIDPSGAPRREFALAAVREGEWEGEAGSIGPEDAPGPWRVRLRGDRQGTTSMRDEFRFLVAVKPLRELGHPRLLFDQPGLEALRTRARDEAATGPLAVAVKAAKQRMTDATPENYPEYGGANPEFLGGLRYSTDWTDFTRWRRGLLAGYAIHDGAWLSALLNDADAGGRARQLLLHQAGFATWNHPWFAARKIDMYYPMGYAGFHAAVGYDLLWNLLGDEERATVRSGLFRHVVEPCYTGEVLHNDVPSNFSNHLGVSTAGALLAALAQLGENPENPYMEPQLSGMLAKLEAHLEAGYLGDDSYVESVSYLFMDSDMVVKALEALHLIYGYEYSRDAEFRNAWRYARQVTPPSGKPLLDMGDAPDYWESDSKDYLLWLRQRYADPHAEALLRWIYGPGFHTKTTPDFYDFLWKRDDVAPADLNQLPASKWFREKGNAVFRSGWGDGDLIMNYRCGPHSNHYHRDQGSFLLQYGGENLISEGGYQDYYYNAYYRRFYVQAVAHNTLLLGGYPESQAFGDFNYGIPALNHIPRITHCMTGTWLDALDSELAPVYRERLEHYNRSLLYMKPDYLVLYDEVRARQPETYDWLFHATGDSIRATAGNVRIDRPRASLRMELLAPRGLKQTVEKYPDSENRYVKLSTIQAERTARFLAVMIPQKKEEAASREQWRVERLEGTFWLGARVIRDDAVDTLYFFESTTASISTAAPERLVRTSEFSADARRIVITRSSGRVSRIWGSGLTRLEFNAGESGISGLRLERPATLALRITGSRLDVESDAAMNRLTLTGASQFSEVYVNGSKVEVRKAGGELEVPLHESGGAGNTPGTS